MSGDVEVEADGEVHADDRRQRGPRWGLPAAVAVAGLLVLAVLLTVVVPRFRDGDGASSTTAAPASTSTTVRGSSMATAAPAPTVARDPRLTAAQQALAAWGRFAVNGDMAVLREHFAPDGPQLRLLAIEAPAVAAKKLSGPPYVVTLAREDLRDETPEQAVVRANVRWVRPGEDDQSFGWDVVLRRTGDRWLLWTVRPL